MFSDLKSPVFYDSERRFQKSATKMSPVCVNKRILYCYIFITTILTLSRNSLARVDPSFEKRSEGATFIEQLNFVLNVLPRASFTTFDSMACALECLKRAFCFSFNFAIYPGDDNCKLLHENKYSFPDRFEPSRLYHHYTTMVGHVILDKG